MLRSFYFYNIVNYFYCIFLSGSGAMAGNNCNSDSDDSAENRSMRLLMPCSDSDDADEFPNGEL